MFVKKINKSNSKTGRNYFTCRLCELYHIDDKVRHRNILNIGKLENIRKEDFKLLCDRIEQKDGLVLRNVTRPNMEQANIYSALKFKQTDLKMRKKAVVPHK